ncbi:MAG: hypothetical protein ACRESZ_03195 [Methylococcales bacterium]
MRCWAHLIRKAQGLKESLDQPARQFGTQTLELFGGRQLRPFAGSPRSSSGCPAYANVSSLSLADYRCLWATRGKKRVPPTNPRLGERNAQRLAGCLLRVLQHPELPLTNNAAEPALRHGRSFCAKSPMARAPKTAPESLLPLD